MATNTVQDSSLTAVANAIRVQGEISGTLEFPDEFISAIQNLSPTPSGTVSITQNGIVDVTQYASADVNVSGGGGGIGTLLHTESLGQISYSSTTAASLDKSVIVDGATDYDMLIVVISADNKLNSRHQLTMSTVLLTTNSSFYPELDGNKKTVTMVSNKINYMKSIDTIASKYSGMGIYPNSGTISDGTITMPIWARYSSANTGTIDDTYTVRVYGINLCDLIP